jgi:uncharacterized membrane protein
MNILTRRAISTMKISNWKQPSFLIYVLAPQVIAWIALVLNIPIVRQVLGFLYLMFVPGFLIIRTLKLERLSLTEIILFSTGLSIFFLMFIGLLVNGLGSSIFISKPLSTEPLVIVISISILFLSIISYFKNKEDFRVVIDKDLRMLHLAPYFALPIIGIIGVMLATGFENNLLLISTIIAISILFVSTSFSKFSFHYPLASLSMASTLLLMTFLTSNYLHGYDIHLDYVASNLTKNAAYWNLSLGMDTYYRSGWPLYIYNSMLSITVLPTIFSNILNLEEIWIYKIIYPLIFSLVPLGLYQLYQRQWGGKVALLSVLFFISHTMFFDFRNTVKQMVAELFFILLFLVLLKKDINQISKWILFGCFSFALIVSYYTMNYLFLFLIFSTWLCAKIFGKKNIKINSLVVLFFALLTFLWYMYIVNGPFEFLARFLKGSFQNFFEEFFIPQSRAGSVLYVTGIVGSPSFLHNFGRILFNITAFFILAGFIVLIFKRKKEKLELEYFSLISINMVLLLMIIIVPNISKSLQMDRMYHVTLLFLSPLFILGSRTCFENSLKILRLKNEKKRESCSLILILTVLVAFFLFQTGLVYEIAGDPVPSSITLSKYKMDDYTRLNLGLVDENDFFGAIWLSKYANIGNIQIYSDTKSRFQVLASCMINRNNNIISISNTTIFMRPSYIYLNRYNIVNGMLAYDTRYPFNIQFNVSEIYVFNSTTICNNKIYSNSACEIYYYAP